MRGGVALAVSVLLLALAGSSCARGTSRLAPLRLQQLESEGITRRGDDLQFRYSHGLGSYRGGWEEGRASIIVTKSRILIHSNERDMIEITPRSTGNYSIRREGDRLSLRAGANQSARSWAFHPNEDPEGWAKDMRAVLEGTAAARRSR